MAVTHNPARPETYPRRILLAVTGLSPQIVTETLYALATASAEAFVPTEVHVLTTLDGAGHVRNSLLHPDGGHFHALRKDYPQLRHVRFDDAGIHLIADASGTPLPDIRTPEENAAAADAITALVQQLTADPNAALHVSIAGGRKTMGFYLGYALSLFARPQDRLSHVLVSAPFEGHPEFFYPPCTPRRLVTRDGRHHIDTADARVTLADIPFVRLRHGLPDALAAGRAGYSETVTALQASFAAPRLEIDLCAKQARCGSRPVPLKPALLAWLAWWAESALAGQPMKSWREVDPEAFLRLYARVVGPDAEALEKARLRLADGMEEGFFQQNNAKLEAALKETLGPAAMPYLLGREGKKPHTRRGLTLPVEAITMVTASGAYS
jgi:CRISPR-associated protein (TIGR02584 family)